MTRRPTIGNSPLKGQTPMEMALGLPPKGAAKTTSKASKGAPEINPNPPKGEKGDFLKVTVTLSPEIYAMLAEESSRRRVAKAKDSAISALIREAVVEKFFGK